MAEPTHVCGCCREALPAEAFFTNRARPSGVTSQCKACLKAKRKPRSDEARSRDIERKRVARLADPTASAQAQRDWKVKNPDKVRQHRQKFKERHPERVREWDRAYKAAAQEKLAAHAAAYYLRHTESVKARARAWQAANPQKVSEKRQRYRARRAAALEGPVDIDALWTGFCAICKDPIDPTLRRPNVMCRSIDHIVPLSRGGSHTQDNLAWVHLLCNMRKGNRTT